MTLPFFYIREINLTEPEIILDEDTSRHVIQVLRMKAGETLNVTDGKGNLLTCLIADENKKKCRVNRIETRIQPPRSRQITIAISLVKNNTRFEWFLEKAGEIGIQEIVPVICKRTEKQRFRRERMEGILISAMLQSRQCWLPTLQEPVPFPEMVIRAVQQQKFIAHCVDGNKGNLGTLVNSLLASQIILIGPEGDFTKEEIDLAIQNHFIPVTLGETRLRTETAGMVAAVLLTNTR